MNMFSGLPAVLCQTDCEDTVIGNNDDTEYNEAMDSMIYLNLNNPAQCNGTISSYRYCHYPTDVSGRSRPRPQYNAILAVFRLMGNTYQPVARSTVSLTVRMTRQFTCCNIEIRAGSVQLEPGDVLGACVGRRNKQNDRRRLNLAGNTSNKSVSISGVPVSLCNNQTSLIIFRTDNLTTFLGRILHLSAEFSELFIS